MFTALSRARSSPGPSIFEGSLRSTADRCLSEDRLLEQSPLEEEEEEEEGKPHRAGEGLFSPWEGLGAGRRMRRPFTEADG